MLLFANLDLSHSAQLTSGAPGTQPTAVTITDAGQLFAGLGTARSTGLGTPILIKDAPARLYGWQFFNTAAGAAYVKLYDQKKAPTLGSDVPQNVIAIPGTGKSEFSCNIGIEFGSGLAWAGSTSSADSSTVTGAAGQIIGELYYR